jgi:uncharacterized protein
MILRRILFLLPLLLLPLKVAGLDIPPATGYVNDRAEIISSGAEQKLERFLKGFRQSDSTQIVVLTIDSLEGEALDGYAIRVAESWGIGQEGKDNGALLLIAKEERKVRIEVGYGLEGRLTDLLSGRIIDNEITPRFKAGDFDGGVIAGVAAMAEAVRGEYQGTASARKKERNPLGLLALLLFLGPGLMFLGGGPRSRRSRHYRHGGLWIGGGGFGGGGFSGGGGGFGGGGASGGW